MSIVGQGQLTFEVEPHRDAVERAGGLQVAGTLTVKGAFVIPHDLNHGDQLLVTVADADGNVLASREATISAPPRFLPIEDKDLGLLGYERSHTCKLDDD